jgi:hypothetical protein
MRWATDNKSHLSWCMELADPYEARIAKERAEQVKELAACTALSAAAVSATPVIVTAMMAM